MINKIQQYKLLFFFSLTLFLGVFLFSFGIKFFDPTETRAAAKTWDGGGGDNNWCTATNWDDDTLPTSTAYIVFNSATTTIVSGCDIEFYSLTIGGGASSSTLELTGNISSGTDITIANQGTLRQMNWVQQTISGDLVVASGGLLTHGNNYDSKDYKVDFKANNIDVQAGGEIDVSYLGYEGGYTGEWGLVTNDPYGPGAGTSVSEDGYDKAASGAGHCGNGGESWDGTHINDSIDGGEGYCNMTDINDLGSGGGTVEHNVSAVSDAGEGGGLIILEASNTVNISGSILSKGGDGNLPAYPTDFMSGGGSGGAVQITADIISGIPTLFDVSGGGAVTSTAVGSGVYGGGGGGGGCVSLFYETSNSLAYTDIIMNGGTGYETGGAGILYTRQDGLDGDLYLNNNGNFGAQSQHGGVLTANSLTLKGGAIYNVNETRILELTGSDPLASGDGDSIFFLASEGTLITPVSTTLSNYVYVEDGAIWQNSSSTDIILSDGATLSQESFTTSSEPLWFNNFTIQSGGKLTHSDNSTEQTHVLNMKFNNLTVASGGEINVDGKGYDGGDTSESDGYGPGAGINNSCNIGAGGGHGGDGASTVCSVGGTAYCSQYSPQTIGSGGSASRSGAGTFYGGDGGGLIMLQVVNDFVLNGILTADGTNGGTSYGAGGGAGGGIWVRTKNLSGSLDKITANGGYSGSTISGAGGGGGCIFVYYSDAYTFTGDLEVIGGDNPIVGSTDIPGEDGTNFYNQEPKIVFNNFGQRLDGSKIADINITVDDSDDDDSIQIKAEYKAGATCSESTSDPTLNTTVSSTFGAPVLNNDNVYQISFVTTSLGANTLELTWPIDTDVPTADGLYCIQLTTNDGMSTGTFFATTTFDVVAPTAPGALTVASQNSDLAYLYFGATSTDTNFNQYLVYYSTSTPITILNTEINSSTITALGLANYNNESSFSINGLDIDTYYYANIWAYDLFGNSASSTAEVNFITDPDVPSGLVATVTKNSITLSWSALVSGNPIEYQAWVSLNSGNLSDWQTATNYTFTELTAGTEYTLKVKARNASSTEESAWSGVINVSTESEDSTGGGIFIEDQPDLSLDMFFINDNDVYTNSTDVVINFNQDINNVIGYTLSREAGNFSGEFNSWVDNVVYKISGGDGIKYVYGRFKIKKTLDSSSFWYYDREDYIILDTTPPTLLVELDDGVIDGESHVSPKLSGRVSDNNSLDNVRIKICNIENRECYFIRSNVDSITGIALGTFSYYLYQLPLDKPGEYNFSVVAIDGANNYSEEIIINFNLPGKVLYNGCLDYPPNITSFGDTNLGKISLDGTGTIIFLRNRETKELVYNNSLWIEYTRCTKAEVSLRTGEVYYNPFFGEISLQESTSFYATYFPFVSSLLYNYGTYIFPHYFFYDVITNDNKDLLPNEFYIRLRVKSANGDYVFGKPVHFFVDTKYVDEVCMENSTLDGCQDSDKDGLINFNDNCRNKPNYINLGTCFHPSIGLVGSNCNHDNDCGSGYVCQKNQEDRDHDNVGDVCDNCLNTWNSRQIDQDKDGLGDYCDNCRQVFNPEQRDRNNDGVGDMCTDYFVCTDEFDHDCDGVPNEEDNCSEMYNPNQLDSDGDGWGNVCDECKNDPNKISFGVCGCGILDEDKDSDGVICEDRCPYDGNKTQIGICGCGTADVDSDGDGLMDCVDQCPNDSSNTCEDLCPNDSDKRFPGICGCGTADVDSDGDGIMNCNDRCPNDPENKCNEEEPCVGPDCEIVEPPCVGPNCGSSGDEQDDEWIEDGVIDFIKDLPENVIENIKEFFDFVSEFSNAVVVSIKKVIDNPQVEAINKKYIAPSLVTVGAANVIVGMQFGQLLAVLRSIFVQPLLLSRLKKKKKWGVIYNAFTKEPISLATIRVLNSETNQIIRTQVTDSQGRYLLVLDPGKYRIEVDKAGFSGFSEYLMNKNEDAKYINLYHGGMIEVSEKDTNIDYNIPLDPNSENKEVSKLLRDKLLSTVKYVVSFSGLTLTAISFIITPTAVVAAFFFAHLLFFSLFYKFSHSIPPPHLGQVTDTENEPVENTIVRVFDSVYNKLVNSTITNQKGQYAILVGPSTYYVTYEKPGYEQAKTDIIDLSSEKTSGMGGIIDLNEKLKKI